MARAFINAGEHICLAADQRPAPSAEDRSLSLPAQWRAMSETRKLAAILAPDADSTGPLVKLDADGVLLEFHSSSPSSIAPFRCSSLGTTRWLIFLDFLYGSAKVNCCYLWTKT
jgi:hypothetical protein